MPQCNRIAGTRYRIDGVLGDYLASVSEQWLKVAPRANPALLEMFRDRDRRPLREMVMWAGEFAGKYLTGAVQVLRVTGDPSLCGRWSPASSPSWSRCRPPTATWGRGRRHTA